MGIAMFAFFVFIVMSICIDLSLEKIGNELRSIRKFMEKNHKGKNIEKLKWIHGCGSNDRILIADVSGVRMLVCLTDKGWHACKEVIRNGEWESVWCKNIGTKDEAIAYAEAKVDS
jgi:flagellar biogenesis protein FliO